MKKLPLLPASLGLLLGALACGGPQDDTDELSQANRSGTNDQGTRLIGAPGAADQGCNMMGMGVVTLSGTLTSTGSADSAVITAAVDDGAETQVGLITPQDFAKGGRVKTAAYSVKLTLPEGMHRVVLCFTQSGSHGRYPKRTCTPPTTHTVTCSGPPPIG